LRYRFKTQQWIPYPVELVFAYFANPHNLPGLMMDWQHFRLEEATIVPPPPRPLAPDPGHRLHSVAAGDRSSLTFSFRPLPYSPVRIPWECMISNFVWNESFADLAVRSPFRYWEHLHRFETETRANAAGVPVQGTLVKDDLEYSPPGKGEAAWSSALQNYFIHPMVKRIFRERHEKVVKILPVVLGRIVPLDNSSTPQS
jgi:ligand-binding SRPBCC domain-containing protein